jgi:hypothetical protein
MKLQAARYQRRAALGGHLRTSEFWDDHDDVENGARLLAVFFELAKHCL